MKEPDWLQMLADRQTLHCVSRKLLNRGQVCTLTASELELLSLLYLDPEENTPLALSSRSGMKKEAVSRCIRQLLEQHCLRRETNPLDERSYSLYLTDQGLGLLEENYSGLLRPLYALYRAMGPDFEQLFVLLRQAEQVLEYQKDGKEAE